MRFIDETTATAARANQPVCTAGIRDARATGMHQEDIMKVEGIYDPRTSTVTYVVFDATTRDAIVIDPVADYDPVGSRLFFESLDAVGRFVTAHQLNVHYILETHAHADHLSGAAVLAKRLDARVAVNRRITQVQSIFKAVFGLPADFPTDGQQFDRLFGDGEIIEAGSLRIVAHATPGHTPACTTFEIEDALFTGDLLFMPDQGTGRCDFPGGSVDDMYRSIQTVIYTRPDATRIFVGHDYQPGGRAVRWETTVGAQKAGNVQLKGDTTQAEFAAFRAKRDAGLSAPKLLYQSVQTNIAGGRVPVRSGARRFLKIPVNVFPGDIEGALGVDAI